MAFVLVTAYIILGPLGARIALRRKAAKTAEPPGPENPETAKSE
jgi:hypothetical protein